MSEIGSLTLFSPFFSEDLTEETYLSKALRVTAVCMGIVSIVGGILCVSGVYFTASTQLEEILGWFHISGGCMIITTGIFLKCIKREI